LPPDRPFGDRPGPPAGHAPSSTPGSTPSGPALPGAAVPPTTLARSVPAPSGGAALSPAVTGPGGQEAPRPLRIGIGGPVGSGKTALVAALARSLAGEVDMAVVTNDIYTIEDALILRRAAVLPDERIVPVETGCCPHTAIRDDITANLDAVEGLEGAIPGLRLVLVESGGDNLTATFSYGLVDAQIFVIDVAGGDKVPRKGGPGITAADLLVVNKVDLAGLVGADLSVMADDAAARRGVKPVLFTSLVADPLATEVAAWVKDRLVAHENPAVGQPRPASPSAGWRRPGAGQVPAHSHPEDPA